jgi:phosphorylcholine metabolism protein LicD
MTEILREFNKLCRKYNIPYWCISGTFIGAVRHNGWIPWDGDVDIGILEKDYKILKTKIHELPSHLFFQDIKTDKHYRNWTIGKIRDINSHYSTYKSYPWHNGLQLDIFPYAHTGENLVMWNYICAEDSPYDMVFPLKTARFEDINVYIPNKYKEYSIKHFGAYPPEMPPVNKRLSHEGNMISDQPSPDDMIRYPHLYIKNEETK